MSKYRVEYYYQTKQCFSIIEAYSVTEIHATALKEFLKIKRPKWNYNEIHIKRVNEIIEVDNNDIKKGNKPFDFLMDICNGKK